MRYAGGRARTTLWAVGFLEAFTGPPACRCRRCAGRRTARPWAGTAEDLTAPHDDWPWNPPCPGPNTFHYLIAVTEAELRHDLDHVTRTAPRRRPPCLRQQQHALLHLRQGRHDPPARPVRADGHRGLPAPPLSPAAKGRLCTRPPPRRRISWSDQGSRACRCRSPWSGPLPPAFRARPARGEGVDG